MSNYVLSIATTMVSSSRCSKKTHHARGWNAAEICTHCVYTIPAPRDRGPIPYFGQAGGAPCRLAGSAPQKAGDVESNPGATTHTNKHTPLIWICELCHKQINKNKPQSDVTTHTTHTGFI